MDVDVTPEASGQDPTRRQRAVAARKLRDSVLSRRLAVFLVGPLATLLAAIVLVFFVLFSSSTISGPSMLPTLQDHDYVLATKGLPDPMRGDIVIIDVMFKGRLERWIKRIVGLPGDTVDVAGDAITVNGSPEQFPHQSFQRAVAGPIEHVIVPAGRVFLAGDNRPVSEDSRFVGTFPLRNIIGRVVFIYAPITRFGPVAGPAR